MRGGITFTELKAMDVFEFFITLTNYEEEIDKEVKRLEAIKNKNKK